MQLLLKHIAVRLWTALAIGGLSALVVIPLFAGIVGPGWMIVPGLGLLGAAYWLSGMAFRAMGRRRLERLIGEATVWERAGMDREARQTLARAEATVDSFFFSPFSRRGPAKRLLAQMARFRLAQTNAESSSDSIIEAYLRQFPQDREAAIKWLEGVLGDKGATRNAQDIAAGIGAALPGDGVIQGMLARFYVAERRCDFAALQTYGRLMAAGEPVTDDLLGAMTDLFLAERRADGLALHVYLDARERGYGDERLSAGIAACCEAVRPSPLTRPLLERADAELGGMDRFHRRKMTAAFLPETAPGGSERPPSTWRIARPVIGPAIRNVWMGLSRSVHVAATVIVDGWRNIRERLSSRQARSTVKWIAMGLFMAIVGALVINTAIHVAADFNSAQKTPEPVVVPVTDPFTLQVAAYLNEADARRFVDQLKKQGLDAYWTRATGTSKTWYQVRVSHFATKEDARSVGDDLKKRQLISDYYVANYKRPDVP